jgi:hypothetical protein
MSLRCNLRYRPWVEPSALRGLSRKPTLQCGHSCDDQWTEETLPDPDSLEGEPPTKIINVFLRRLWTGQFRSKPCAHVYLARSDIGPASEVCGKCVALGDSWPALRMCLLCGYVALRISAGLVPFMLLISVVG